MVKVRDLAEDIPLNVNKIRNIAYLKDVRPCCGN